jgi:hypothetical protein
MLRILKLFGFDIPARIAAVRADLESRADLAMVRLTRAARTVGILILLAVLAAMAGTAAVGVGLTALYSWIALEYGEFYGYAAVGGVLIFIAAVLGVIGFVEANSWSFDSLATPDEIPTAPIDASTYEAPDDPSSERRSVSAIDKIAEGAAGPPPPRRAAWPEDASPSQALPGLMSLPVTGNALIDGVIDGLRTPASRAVDDVVGLATETIRRGEREQLLMTLGMAIFAGWLAEKMRSRHVAGPIEPTG